MAEDRSWVHRLAQRVVSEDAVDVDDFVTRTSDDAHHRLRDWKKVLAANPRFPTIAAQHQPHLAALQPNVLKRIALELIEFAYAFGCLFISQPMEQEYHFRRRLGLILTNLSSGMSTPSVMQHAVARQRTEEAAGMRTAQTMAGMRIAALKKTPLSRLPLNTLARREMVEGLIEAWEAILQNTLLYVTSMYDFLKQTGEEHPWTEELVLVLRNMAIDDDDHGMAVENLLLWDLNALENDEDPEDDDLLHPVMNPHSLPLRGQLPEAELERIARAATRTLVARVAGLSPLAQYALGKPLEMRNAMVAAGGAGAGAGGAGAGAGNG
jgi:hypothetical protein